jgi:hypothetical protein
MVHSLQPQACPYDLSTNLVRTYIEDTISRCEYWIKAATKVKKIALYAIAIVAAGTALVYISPTLPLIGTIVLAAVSIAAVSRDPSHSSSMYGLALFISGAASLSGKLVGWIYTRRIINISITVNSVFSLPSLCVVGIAYWIIKVLERKRLLFQEMAITVSTMQVKKDYEPTTKMRKILAPLYDSLYVQKYNRGCIPTLPITIEQQIQQITSKV